MRVQNLKLGHVTSPQFPCDALSHTTVTNSRKITSQMVLRKIPALYDDTKSQVSSFSDYWLVAGQQWAKFSPTAAHPLCGGSRPPSTKTMFLRPQRVFMPNRTLIRWAIFIHRQMLWSSVTKKTNSSQHFTQSMQPRNTHKPSENTQFEKVTNTEFHTMTMCVHEQQQQKTNVTVNQPLISNKLSLCNAAKIQMLSHDKNKKNCKRWRGHYSKDKSYSGQIRNCFWNWKH